MKTIKDEAARLGITPAELERRIDEARGAITRGIARLSFGGNDPDDPNDAATPMPPGYEPGSHLLRLPDAHAMKIDPRAQWVKPGRGCPAFVSPLEKAVTAHEVALLKSIGKNRRKPAADKASQVAAETRKAKTEATRAAVADLTAQGKRPHTIAHALGITARRVRQIQAAATKPEITAAEK